MSATVDSRVVEMRFDNKQFESGVATTISTLDKFKQMLKLDGATKGMESVDAAAKKIDMSGLGTAVESVSAKFSALQVMGVTALANITNSAVNAGKRIVSALTIEPIKTGLQEYETQINAVQTILANTESKGTTLKDVNGALDELNTYADKTIYNFTEMTRNIGTFTAAGVDLDTSVNAIQGIANLAAVSGSSSQQASTAMYQLSQAMASGTVKLMDWNSVVNAGMGGQVFQDALKETAKVHGVNVDAMIKKHGSFRETLQEGWITTDILTETLSHFTMAAEEGSKEWGEFKKTLMDQGYSEEQANAILKMSNTATDAATKVKTATQLFDTLKETAQSGWTQTWEIIMGDFEEAKNLFSMLYETLAPIIDASSKARNDILEGWAKAGGRDDLIESLQNVFKAISSIVKPIKKAFESIFPASLDDKVNGLVNFTKGLKDFTARLTLSSKASANLKRTFKGLFALLDIGKQIFTAVFKAISPLFGGVDDLGGGILGITAKIGDWIVGLNNSIKASGFFETAVTKIHGALEKVKNFLQPVIESIRNFGDEISKNLTAVASNAEARLGPLSALGNFIKAIFVGLGKIVKTIFPYISAAATGIGNVLSELMGRITDSIQNADYDSAFDLLNGGILSTIGIFIAKFIKSGSDILDNAGGFVESINNILGGVGDALGAFTESTKADTLKKIATAVAILAGSLLVLSLIPSEKLSEALFSITTLFAELMGSMSIFSKIGDIKGIAKTAGSLVALASAVLILSVALKIMSTMSWAEMGVGLISMTVGLGELVGAVWLLSMLPEKDLKASTKAIKTLASSLLVLSVALKIMSTMSWEGMGVALISMTVGLGALVGAIWLLPKDTALRAAGLIGLATAMVILGGALKIMATMSWGELAVSLVALAGSLAIIAVAMNFMTAAIPGALAMLIVAPALVVLSGAMLLLGGLSWEEVGRGLVALGGAMLILAAGLTLMIAALPGAAALLVAAAALAVLTPVLMALGSMSLAEIGKGLLVLAGVFAVLGLSALILQPLIPAILGLCGALALLGVATVLVGAGVLMVGVGITALAAAVATSGGAIVVFISSIISLIPYLIEQIGVGIIKLCEVIAGSAAAICDAVAVIIVAVIEALVKAVPPLVEGLMVLIVSVLESLVTHLPTIVTHLVTIVIKLLELLTQHVPALVGALVAFLAAVLSSITENLTTLITPLVDLVVAIFQGIADAVGPIINDIIIPILEVFKETVVEIADALGGVLEDLGGVFDSVFDGISEVVTSVGDSIRTVLDGISGIIESIGEAALNAGTGFENLAKGVKIITDLKLTDMVASLAAVATGIGKIGKHSDEISDVGDGMAQVSKGANTAASKFESISRSITTMSSKFSSAKAALTSLVNAFTSAGTTMTKVGKDLLGNVVAGIESQQKKLGSVSKTSIKLFVDTIKNQKSAAKKECTTLVSSCADAISAKSGEFKTAAKNLVKGFANAISANTYLAKAKAKAMAAAAADAARKELDEHSPSKVGYEIGDFFGIAFVNGIADNIKKAYSMSTDLAKSAHDGVNEAINRIAVALSDDIDTQPTIRPVLDLSDVQSGASALNGMLGAGSIGVRANLGAISSMMSARGQNGSNADVVSELAKLRKDIGNLSNTTYQVNGVTYDDGSNITDAVRTIVRAVKIGGRV